MKRFFIKLSPKIKIIAASVAAFLLAVAIFLFVFIVVGGGVHSRFSRSLDLSGRSISDSSALEKFRSVRRLDISDTGITELDGLKKLRHLEYADVRNNPIPAEEILELKAALPENCVLIYSVKIGDEYIEAEAEEVIITDETSGECSALMLIDSLKIADITRCRLNDSIINVSDNDCRTFEWRVRLCGENQITDERTLVLDSPTDDDLAKLKLFRGLSYVTISGKLPESLIDTVTAMPECDFNWTVNLCGVNVGSNESSVDISGRQVENIEEFKRLLDFLPNLTYIDMCDCGLSNEQMGGLREQFPSIKFVWKVTFGGYVRKWTVRTDITCFSSLGTQRCNDEQLEPLFKYCTDLVALDLGHNDIRHIGSLSNLKHLKALIIMDNDIDDLPAITALQELEYIEIYSCKLSDISPIAELPNLQDVNIGSNYITDITPFLGMKQLRRLWITDCGLTKEKVDRLREALPDCDVYTFSKGNPGFLWRYDERNTAIRKAFNNWWKIVRYTNWDDVEYIEGAKLVEMHMEQ